MGEVVTDGWTPPRDWDRRVEWLWSQDDAIPHEDTVGRAWAALFGGSVPVHRSWLSRVDHGDAESLLYEDGRVYLSSYPGENRLGVVPGSPASVVPRMVVSDGSSGVAWAALDAAEECRVTSGGRRSVSDGNADSGECQLENARDSGGTLLCSLGHRLADRLDEVRRAAEARGRPCLHVTLSSDSDRQERVSRAVTAFVRQHSVGVLNVSGSSEEEEPGVYEATLDLVRRVLLSARVEARAIVAAATADVAVPAVLAIPDAHPVAAAPASPVADPPAVNRPAPSERQPSAGQDLARDVVGRWMRDRGAPQVLRLFGYAGTGKTTIARELVEGDGGDWLFGAFTGKAALVMRQKGCPGAQTIHSMIYRASGEPGEDPNFSLWDESPLHDARGVVLDECSMVDRPLGDDVLSFGRKVLVIMDPFQLPPVSGGGFFVGDPDVLLTEVYRQQAGSGVLDLATHVRSGGSMSDRLGWSSPSGDCRVISRGDVAPGDLLRQMVDADQVIVGTNRTRQAFNERYRRMLRVADSPTPVPGERVICLRNQRRAGLFNGSMWLVEAAVPSADRRTVDLELRTLDSVYPDSVRVRSWAHHFVGRGDDLEKMGPARMACQEFDFAYNVTCHKAQGSQWDSVVLFDESGSFDRETRPRWLYTGITRAARQLLVVL